MSKPKSFFRVFTETGPLIALGVAVALLVGIVGPASAQFFNFGGPPPRPPASLPAPPRGGGFGGFGGGAATSTGSDGLRPVIPHTTTMPKASAKERG